MKRSWTSYVRYAAAALLLYLVFVWSREHMETEEPECPVGQSATQDADKTWRCMCNDPELTLVEGVCSTPKKLIDPMDPKTWANVRS
jgi:hypothetical protein